MIKDKALDEALIEIMRCKKALEALRAKRKRVAASRNDGLVAGYEIDRHCTVEHAAAKRASLDLTRKLSDLRARR